MTCPIFMKLFEGFCFIRSVITISLSLAIWLGQFLSRYFEVKKIKVTTKLDPKKLGSKLYWPYLVSKDWFDQVN